LSNAESRTEYDEYISQSRFSANYAGEKIDDESARKRKEEKGKKRFEEDFSYANEEFFSAWQNRTGSKENKQDPEEEEKSQNYFDGKNAKVDV
jgi:hypothetical protein